MIDAPRMLMLGSSGRDSGKTTFACALIEKLKGRQPLIGAKVTTIRERGGTCPRGARGCGVCGSLQGPYCITEEKFADGAKDTQRLLAAGAKKVYWLRVLKDHLEEGASALLDEIDKSIPVICESNSLRTVVEPGLFLMFRRRARGSIKASAKTVLKHADQVVAFDGQTFDFDLDDLDIADGAWVLRCKANHMRLTKARRSHVINAPEE